jgi:hypothetical protein
MYKPSFDSMTELVNEPIRREVSLSLAHDATQATVSSWAPLLALQSLNAPLGTGNTLLGKADTVPTRFMKPEEFSIMNKTLQEDLRSMRLRFQETIY